MMLSVPLKKKIYDKNLTVIILISIVCGFVFAEYLRAIDSLKLIVRMILIGLCILSYIKEKHFSVIFESIFSCVFSLIIIFGYHMNVTSQYTGLIDTEYITDYSFFDVLAFFIIAYTIFRYIALLNYYVSIQTVDYLYTEEECESSYLKTIVIDAILIMILYSIYLFVYYPGFVFGDTLSSVEQVVGNAKLNNHYPIIYTFSLKICLEISHFLGRGNTFGCAIHNICLITYISFGLSIFSNWLIHRFSLRRWIKVALIIFYGITPYFALYGVAMWKDPWFAITLVLISIISFDISKGYISAKKDNKKIEKKGVAIIVSYYILIVFSVFIRNNGLYILFLITLYWLGYSIIYKKKIWLGFSLLVLSGLLFYVTGPLYERLGIKEESIESYGILLNQMARVATYEGDLNEDDKEYLNNILPYEMYKSVYTPGCVDSFKWNPQFNRDALIDFVPHWYTIGIKNKRLYFEAWEFLTAGSWAVNIPSINARISNINSGVPINLYNNNKDFAASFGIYPVNHESLQRWFVSDEWFVPAPWIHWFIVLIVFLSIYKKRYEELSLLIPSIGVVLTLLVASPIQYWPRYYLTEQIMIPCYIVLYCAIFRSVNNKK